MMMDITAASAATINVLADHRELFTMAALGRAEISDLQITADNWN